MNNEWIENQLSHKINNRKKKKVQQKVLCHQFCDQVAHASMIISHLTLLFELWI